MFVTTALKILCRHFRPFGIGRRGYSKGSKKCVDSKIVPKLVYIHNPWMYFLTRFQLIKLRLLWDKEFDLKEFYRGTKQAAIVMTKCIQKQDGIKIGSYTTPVGFQQITRDMIISRNDNRLKLVNFRAKDFCRSIPIRVALFKRGRNRNCFINMLLVGMRNTKDFPDFEEYQMIQKTLNDLDKNKKNFQATKNIGHRIIFAEINMRFFRDYTPETPNNWSVSFYKIISFDVLNYSP